MIKPDVNWCFAFVGKAVSDDSSNGYESRVLGFPLNALVIDRCSWLYKWARRKHRHLLVFILLPTSIPRQSYLLKFCHRQFVAQGFWLFSELIHIASNVSRELPDSALSAVDFANKLDIFVLTTSFFYDLRHGSVFFKFHANDIKSCSVRNSAIRTLLLYDGGTFKFSFFVLLL